MAQGQHKLPVIGITMGDPVGIGPEIIVKALCDPTIRSRCLPLVIGDRNVLEREQQKLKAPCTIMPVRAEDDLCVPPACLPLLEVSQLQTTEAPYGQPNPKTGAALAAAIIKAVELAMAGTLDAVVTAPINKQSLQAAGYNFPGHTEMIASLTQTPQVVMMLAGSRLRVVLVTIHCALARVPKLISPESILSTLRITHRGLRDQFGIAQPRIAVAGLNPHAGEAGLFGCEEQTIIAPAIRAACREGICADGPFPPDTVFYKAARGDYDVVVCMYHDQGLIPLKLLHFDDGVNITLGLPIIRTSVDHGTAYDIAGTGIASPASMVQAIQTAIRMATTWRNRTKQHPAPELC